jgi:hypothetical protein
MPNATPTIIANRSTQKKAVKAIFSTDIESLRPMAPKRLLQMGGPLFWVKMSRLDRGLSASPRHHGRRINRHHPQAEEQQPGAVRNVHRQIAVRPESGFGVTYEIAGDLGGHVARCIKALHGHVLWRRDLIVYRRANAIVDHGGVNRFVAIGLQSFRGLIRDLAGLADGKHIRPFPTLATFDYRQSS